MDMVARYLTVSKDLEKAKPQRQLFASKADAVAWLSAEATAYGFVYEPPRYFGRPHAARGASRCIALLQYY